MNSISIENGFKRRRIRSDIPYNKALTNDQNAYHAHLSVD